MRMLLIAAILLLSMPSAAQAPRSCLEDEPCWNCHTMGNKVCMIYSTVWRT